jgi:tRNA-binding protein
MPDRPTVEDLEALVLRIGTVKITEFYDAGALVGRQVIVETGFEPIRVGGFRSDVLVIGALTFEGVVLLKPDKPVPPRINDRITTAG